MRITLNKCLSSENGTLSRESYNFCLNLKIIKLNLDSSEIPKSPRTMLNISEKIHLRDKIE